jgi:hypothetical protein
VPFPKSDPVTGHWYFPAVKAWLDDLYRVHAKVAAGRVLGPNEADSMNHRRRSPSTGGAFLSVLK